MASRQEERERLRQQRLAAQRQAESAERRRVILGYVVAGLIVAAIVVGIVVAVAGGGDDGGGVEDVSAEDVDAAHIVAGSGSVNDVEPDTREGTAPPELQDGDLERSAKAAGCELQLDLRDEGNTHIRPSADPPKYGTNPATSGDHIVPPLQQADGAYSETPEEHYVVHSLEHGRIAIQYSPDLPEEDQLLLKGLFDESPEGMLLFPNPDMPYDVAATAWTQLVGCEGFDGQGAIDALRNFRDTFRGQGPEPVPLVLSG